MRYKFSRLRLKGYDGYVFFGSHSISAAKRHHPNVLWSTRPLAYVYGWDGKGPDKNTEYLFGTNFLRKIAVKFYIKLLRILDQREIKNIDKIHTVGVLAENALRAAYPKKEISVLYAPIPVERYKYLSKGKYYLNVARHVPDKNVDRIIRAFQKMPDKILYQIGDYSDDSVKKLADGYKNIKILGFKNESELGEIMGKSIAMISASEGEDFSMNLMESLASGKPTISVNIDRNVKTQKVTETGILMPNSNPEEIIKAVKFMTSAKSDKLKKKCLEKSKLFSRENFIQGILKALKF